MKINLLINSICIIIIDIILIINLLNYKKLNTKVNLSIQLNNNLNDRCKLLYEYIKLLEQEVLIYKIKEGKKNERKNTNRRNKKNEE